MGLLVEVELRIMSGSRHDPSVLVEASRRVAAAPQLYDGDDREGSADALAREIAGAAVQMRDLVPAALEEAIDQAARLTGRVREDLGG